MMKITPVGAPLRLVCCFPVPSHLLAEYPPPKLTRWRGVPPALALLPPHPAPNKHTPQEPAQL